MQESIIDQNLSKFFGPEKSKIIEIDRPAVNSALGFEFTDEELIGLAGAPAGSTLSVKLVKKDIERPGPTDPQWKIEHLPKGVKITIVNDLYIREKNEIIIYSTEGGNLGVYVKLVKLTKAFGIAGTAALMTESMIRTIDAIENNEEGDGIFDEFSLLAAGGRFWGTDGDGQRWIGYNVWPKFGYDMELHRLTQNLLPHFPNYPVGLGGCKTVSSVLALGDEGKDFWKLAGDGWYMKFDLKSEVSKLRLRDYLSRLS